MKMKFQKIDIEHWSRKEYFEHYFNHVPCYFSMTVNLDITPIIHKHKRIYPTMLYYLTKTVNQYEGMKMGFDEDGHIGIYDEMIPSYTIFHKDTNTFSNIWTEFHENEED